MRSRWFHAPALHQGHGKRVSWLELFYDLIFVASIIQLGDFLSASVTLQSFGLFLLHFTPLWLAWTGFTVYANRFDVDDFLHRTLVLVQMFAVGTMAIFSHDAMNGSPAGFAVAFAVAQAVISGLYLRAWIQVPEARPYARFWGLVFAVGAVSFALSALLPSPWTYILWGVGLLGVLAAPWSPQSQALTDRYPIDMHHLSERYGLLTIIVLGESFVKVLSYLTAESHGDPGYLAKGFFNLAITCCLWWVYFDDVAGSHVKKGRGSFLVWLMGHLPLTAAITAVGVAVKKAIKFDLHEIPDEKYRWLLAGSLALGLLSVAIVDSVTERRNNQLSDAQRVLVRTASAGAVLLLGQIGGTMTSATFLACLSAIMVVQVLFDMMMAPLEENAEGPQAVGIAELHERGEGLNSGAPAPRLDVGNTVRKGTPGELRRDLYLFFLEGSWLRMLLSFTFLYLSLNAVFAGLYLLDPGSIAENPDNQFGRAFFFSVQTFSTIGYGSMSPQTDWADLLVTIESAVGLLFVAMATGVMLAKASRPRTSVLFSRVMVLNQRDGEEVLTFRVANALGNELADAQITATALIDEVTAEGEHMRRLLDLQLVRSRTPLFVISWTVMHIVDQESPLYGHLLDGTMGPVIVTLTGHDGTYGQTNYARHMYSPGDLRVGERFVDVISRLPDGRLLLDLDLFHDTKPVDLSPS